MATAQQGAQPTAVAAGRLTEVGVFTCVLMMMWVTYLVCRGP